MCARPDRGFAQVLFYSLGAVGGDGLERKCSHIRLKFLITLVRGPLLIIKRPRRTIRAQTIGHDSWTEMDIVLLRTRAAPIGGMTSRASFVSVT